MAVIRPPFPLLTRSHPLAYGLRGAWLPGLRGDATLNDSSGRSESLALEGGPTVVSGPFGGYALSFDGVNDYAGRTDALGGGTGKLDMGLDDWGVVCWLKTTGADKWIVSKSGFLGASNPDAWGVVISATGRPRGVLFKSGRTVFIHADDGTVVNDGLWHQVAVVWDRDGLMTRYVDGKLSGASVDISGESAQSIDSSKGFQVSGRDEAGAEDFLPCTVDHLFVYGRKLLATGVGILYNDPFAMFRPRRLRLWTPPVNGLPPGLFDHEVVREGLFDEAGFA